MDNIILRCIHRHTIESHPHCFVKGLIKYEFKDEKEFEKLTGKPWYQMPGYKIGYFDIETDNLNADFGTLLSWAIKEKGGSVTTAVVNKKELMEGTADKRIVESFVSEMKKYNILVGYYSEYFDMPFMRAKALHYGLDFPGFGDLYHWDLYFTAKSKLKLSRKSLDNVCDYLGIVGKTRLDKEVWRKAKYGDKKALDYVVEHNIGDVEITEMLHDKLEFTRKWIRKSI